jgi:hypothetical protein
VVLRNPCDRKEPGRGHNNNQSGNLSVDKGFLFCSKITGAAKVKSIIDFVLLERNMSDSSRKPVLIERYPPSNKYATSFVGGGDLFISPPSHHSGSSLSEQADSSGGHYHTHHHSHHHSHQSHHNQLARSLSMPGQGGGDSEGCHTSYTSCSVHGTLRYSNSKTKRCVIIWYRPSADQSDSVLIGQLIDRPRN